MTSICDAGQKAIYKAQDAILQPVFWTVQKSQYRKFVATLFQELIVLAEFPREWGEHPDQRDHMTFCRLPLYIHRDPALDLGEAPKPGFELHLHSIGQHNHLESYEPELIIVRLDEEGKEI